MDIEIIEALERAANAMDAASEEMTANPGQLAELSAMTALWLMEEAGAVRSLLCDTLPNRDSLASL